MSILKGLRLVLFEIECAEADIFWALQHETEAECKRASEDLLKARRKLVRYLPQIFNVFRNDIRETEKVAMIRQYEDDMERAKGDR